MSKKKGIINNYILLMLTSHWWHLYFENLLYIAIPTCPGFVVDCLGLGLGRENADKR